MGFNSFSESLRAGCRNISKFKNFTTKKGNSISVGDEEGFLQKSPLTKSAWI